MGLGTCHWAELVPASTVPPERNIADHVTNTGATRCPPLISDTRGVFRTICPEYSTASLGHRLDDVVWATEDSTDTVSQLTPQLVQKRELCAE